MHATKLLVLVTTHWISSIIPSISHKSTINCIIARHTQLTDEDSIRNEWNLKKRNIEKLIKGKNWSTKIKYYQYFLKDKDYKRADSIIVNLSSPHVSIEDRYQISMELFRYIDDSKTQMLFLSIPANVKKYRDYFLSQKVSNLASNKDKRTHYYNLVALDSVYIQMSPDSIDETAIGKHFNSLSWYSMLINKFDNVEYFLKQSEKYDPQSKYYISNLPLLLLLKGKYKEAKTLYLKYKDLPFGQTYSTYKDVFLDDFKELKKANIKSNDIKRIVRILQAKRNY